MAIRLASFLCAATAAALYVAGVGCSSTKGAAAAHGGTEATSTSAAALTWHKDVRPIVEAKCAGCHQPAGIAPFALQSYGDAFAQKAAIAAAVHGGVMPPWPPNAACSSYLNDRSLTAAENDAVVKWASGDAPEGNPADYKAMSQVAVDLSRVDLRLKIPQPYVPRQSPDEYRCFVMDWPSTTVSYVTGFGVEPGNAAIVHHAIAFLATPDLVAQAEALDAADPAPGYSCFGSSGINNAGWVGGWAPGARGGDAPTGTGIKVPPGSKIILQMHYNLANVGAATPAPDQTAIVLKVDPTVQKEAAIVKFTNPFWVTNHTMNIPAHDADVKQNFTVDMTPYLTLASSNVLHNNQPFTMWTASLHMHTRGVKGTLTVVHPDGTSDCALQIDNWNFHWQGSYALKAPLTVKPGDKLSLECHFDNSGARQPIVNGAPLPVADANWGETTEDEMCLGLFYATQ